VDVFRQSDLLDPIEERNQYWARIAYLTKVKAILAKANPSADDNVRVRRRWKCLIVLQHAKSGWKINSYNAKSIALLYE
jgi:hypothetical protein